MHLNTAVAKLGRNQSHRKLVVFKKIAGEWETCAKVNYRSFK